MQAVVAAPCPVMGGLVVVEAVGAAVAAAPCAVGAGAAGAGVGRWGAAGAVTSATGLLFVAAAVGVVLGALASLLALASEQKRRLRPGSSGWPKRRPHAGQVR